MVYLILCIFSSTVILTIFKLAGIRQLNVFRIILVNYILAFLVAGILYGSNASHNANEMLTVLPWAAAIGVIFILMFLLVSKTTAVSGMTVTSIATKMSVVIPVLFSIIYYQESLSILRITGISLALLALILSVYRKSSARSNILFWLLPIILFSGNGLLDSLLKFTQAEKLPDFNIYLFNAMVFGVAMISGGIMSPWLKSRTAKKSHKGKEIQFGVLLGLANLGSLVGMVMALRSEIPSSLVFILNNTGVVVLSTLTGYFAFREKISKTNLAGIILALIAIILVSLNIR